jgi:TatD DNase family protein
LLTFFQVQLACELGKPLLLHERDAHQDLLDILKIYKDQLPAMVIHCFTGTSEQAHNYLQMGMYLGMTGVYLLGVREQYIL